MLLHLDHFDPSLLNDEDTHEGGHFYVSDDQYIWLIVNQSQLWKFDGTPGPRQLPDICNWPPLTSSLAGEPWECGPLPTTAPSRPWRAATAS